MYEEGKIGSWIFVPPLFLMIDGSICLDEESILYCLFRLKIQLCSFQLFILQLKNDIGKRVFKFFRIFGF